ncbi:MAG: MarR family winged helix-turn-helix transcriptional regulator [Pseudomonadota bacterium]
MTAHHGSFDRHTQELRHFVTFRLARLQSKLNAQGIRKLKLNSDLALTEWRIISIAAQSDETTLSSIAQETELDKGQLSRAVKTLAERGLLVSRVNSDDHRQNLLKLTEAGRAQYDKILPVMQKRQSDLTSGFSKQDMDTLMSLLDRLERAADATS